LPWIIGIDEAGYGPNLGPLVMSAVACRLPEDAGELDLWELLKTGVRRHGDEDDGRAVVADSKLVFSQARGLAELERGVWATSAFDQSPANLSRFVNWAAADAEEELRREFWFHGDSPTPATANLDHCLRSRELFLRACAATGVRWASVRSFIVCPERFNQILDVTDSKASVLAHGIHHFLKCPIADSEAAHYFVDKQGGRNHYSAMLQHVLPEGMILAQEEGREKSVYRWVGGPREMYFTFEPRADFAHLCVALASMVSKYLREMLMAEFNRYWQRLVPGLKPTAGYPSDARRYFTAIRPHLERQGIEEKKVWRRK
jgi:ribonuclease HII